ncbi:MAG: hypothetical protein Q4E57_01785 [Eubacteriales bacterium]|nr:hypothetical protein [Eubacteriales bacterium]
MKKSLGIKELILVAILVVIAAYYFVVQGPISKQSEQYALEKQDLQSRIMISESKDSVVKKMRAELDRIYENAGGNPQALAAYSNNKVLLQELNVILNMADSFQITFGEESYADNIMRREIQISYETQSIDAAELIVNYIENSSNTYLITGFSTSCDQNATKWKSTLDLVNYEYVSPKVEEQLGLKDKQLKGDDGKSNAEAVLESLYE